MENLDYDQQLHQQYLDAVDKLNIWSKYYYVYDKPKATDEEYDNLNNTIKVYEKNYPWKIVKHSPTQRVNGWVSKKFEKAKHLTNMWSLEDVFNIEEFTIWFNRIKKLYPDVEFYCQPKFDGLSLNLIYENGFLKQAITRGDGVTGEDVTVNAKTIKNIPLTIPITSRVEIRGEVIIKKTDFDLLNEERVKNNEPLFANPRNTAAGSLRQLDSKITASRNLFFMVWGIGEYDFDNGDNFWVTMFILKDFGFGNKFESDPTTVTTIEEVMSHYQELITNRNASDIMLDGMVVKVNNFTMQKELGYTAKFPKWACAFKFPALEKSTKIIDVEYQVGKTGVITPVAILEPIDLDGVLVEKATLHNFSYIKTKDLKIGDQVIVIRSGDVIPKITSVFTDRRTGVEKDIVTPDVCPCCNNKLYQENVYLKCTNSECSDMVIAYIADFAAKDNLNISGLSKGIIKTLVENNIIKQAIDLYKLKYSDLENLDGFKEKKINNILEAIENSKIPSMDRFIHSLSIPGIGSTASKVISKILSEPLDFLDLTYDRLKDINGFGEIILNNLLTYIKTYEENIWALIMVLKPYIPMDKPKVSGVLNDKVFVITGKFEISRKEIEDKIIKMGGTISNSINKNVNYLIAGENPSDKIKKANKLNIVIIKLEDLDNGSWL